MKYLRYFLFPFSVLYGSILSVRNLFYDYGIFQSKAFSIPVVCVGNLNTGGTGKSPMIELLIRMLQDQAQLATLSRGYKRTTHGFLEVRQDHTTSEVGDEPLQFKTNYPNVHVAVDVDRQRGISTLIQNHPQLDLILLDDAFQHRKVKPDLSILLTSYSDLYTDDLVLPTGNLREFASGAKRANVIIITKCPNQISETEKTEIINKIHPKHGQNVFFSTIIYAKFVSNLTKAVKLEGFDDFTLITGIANPEPLVSHLNSLEKNFEYLAFADHHEFTDDELKSFEKKAKILTTQKDYMRLKSKLKTKNFYYIPIQTKLLDTSDSFKNHLKEYLF